MTESNGRRSEGRRNDEPKAASQSQGVEWPERSHFSEFDQAIENALAAHAEAAGEKEREREGDEPTGGGEADSS